MDVQRTDQHIRRRKRAMLLGIAALTVVGAAIAVARIEPAVPVVESSMIWVDTVQRGLMVRQARGVGTLVPEEITWLSARTAGWVDRILLRPGAIVTPDSIVLVLRNPEVVQAAADAESDLKAAEAAVISSRAQLGSATLAAEAAAATAKAEYEQSKLKAEMNERLFRDGLVSEIDLRLSKVTAEEAHTKYEIEKRRFEFFRSSNAPQLAVKQAEVERARARARLRQDEMAALHVPAGISGVLQSVPVEVGAQVTPGINLARVANPARLKAELRIPETQARDVKIGQLTTVDTRNGLIEGEVSRIDPSAKNGTVTVDITFKRSLPQGVRPDLSVDGIIELERLNDVLFVGRPAFGQEGGTVNMFKLSPQGDEAHLVKVRLGRSSVNAVEILDGLQTGDRVVLSDMSRWNSDERIKLE